MRKPIIGITVESKFDPSDPRSGGKIDMNWNYAQVIADAGGVPIILLPMTNAKDVASFIDGWLITGGADIDAARFGEANHPKVEFSDPSRYDFEAALFEAIPADLPILGICYGCQFLNVVNGGSLIQHVPDVVGHELDQHGTIQAYSVEPESQLADALGASAANGQSWHHQAVGKVAPSMRVVAKNEDGLIEGLESVDRPWVVATQWHPERTPDDSASTNLFKTFVDRATTFAVQKRS